MGAEMLETETTFQFFQPIDKGFGGTQDTIDGVFMCLEDKLARVDLRFFQLMEKKIYLILLK